MVHGGILEKKSTTKKREKREKIRKFEVISAKFNET